MSPKIWRTPWDLNFSWKERCIRESVCSLTKTMPCTDPPGVSHLSWLSNEIFRECYATRSPFEDYLKSTFRSCQLVRQLSLSMTIYSPQQLSQQGRYKEVNTLMNQIAPEKLRPLKANQYWTFFSGILQLKRQINRYASLTSSLPSLPF